MLLIFLVAGNANADGRTIHPGRMSTICYNTLMLVVAFIQWWYGPGWRDAAARLGTRIRLTYLDFSPPILLKTLFAPWRRITATPGTSLEQKFRGHIDNAVSRAVGFAVRLLALLVGGGIIVAFGLLGGLLLILWPILPLVGPALVVGGLL